MLLNKTQQETSDNEMELQLGMASLKAMPSILSQKNLDSLELEKMPQTMTLTGFKKLKRQDLNTNLSLDRFGHTGFNKCTFYYVCWIIRKKTCSIHTV